MRAPADVIFWRVSGLGCGNFSFAVSAFASPRPGTTGRRVLEDRTTSYWVCTQVSAWLHCFVCTANPVRGRAC